MSSASSPPDEGDEIDARGLPKRIRLGEIEEIAAERLEAATEDSLKEALAVAPVDASTPPESRTAEIADAAETEHAAISAEPVDPVTQVPLDTVGEPLFPDAAGLSQAMEPPPPSTAETMPSASVWPSASAPSEAAPEPVTAPAASVWAPESGEAAAEPTGMEPPVEPPEAAPDAFAVVAHPLSADLAADAGTVEAAQPLASALGAAVKLAADANAAREALESLKRLLERQLPNPVQAPLQWVRDPHPEPVAAAPPPPLPPQPPPMAQAEELPRAPARPPPRAIVRHAVVRERRQLDIRGFMAGFALSWAIGAVLYIYLTAG
jgi:hypothetical protein